MSHVLLQGGDLSAVVGDNEPGEGDLAIHRAGDHGAATKFFDRGGAWTPEVHEKLAARIREAQGTSRFRIVRYGVLGE